MCSNYRYYCRASLYTISRYVKKRSEQYYFVNIVFAIAYIKVVITIDANAKVITITNIKSVGDTGTISDTCSVQANSDIQAARCEPEHPQL